MSHNPIYNIRYPFICARISWRVALLTPQGGMLSVCIHNITHTAHKCNIGALSTGNVGGHERCMPWFCTSTPDKIAASNVGWWCTFSQHNVCLLPSDYVVHGRRSLGGGAGPPWGQRRKCSLHFFSKKTKCTGIAI